MKNLFETKNVAIKIGAKIICENLNLQIKAGEIWGILGANGCGKTTLLHTLAGLRLPLVGDIILQSKHVASLTAKEIAREMGILFQDTQFVFSQSVFETCLTGRHPHLSTFAWESAEDKSIALSALSLMQLEDKQHVYSYALSGGEQRRLAIATLLTQTPSLFLLDEPLNHLDIRHQIKVMNYFKTLTQTSNTAVVMTLHDLNIAQHFCNRILILFDDGSTLQGHTDKVLSEQNLLRAYHHPLQAITCASGLYWQPKFNVV